MYHTYGGNYMVKPFSWGQGLSCSDTTINCARPLTN